VAASGEEDPPERPGKDRGWKLSDRLQLVVIVVSLAALGLALYAALSANNAMTKANQLAASANRADLILGSRLSAHIHGTSSYQVRLNLFNQGGGTAYSISAQIGTLHGVHKLLTRTCPRLERSFPFSFPLGTALALAFRAPSRAGGDAVT
jgi:hypothetical protein